jgi:glycosyltransferase involved in cell wall biosynthesis
MRIALLNQFFWPDGVATSQILTDVARPLAQDHQVTAICGGTSATIASSGPDLGLDITIVRARNFGFGHNSFVRVASYVSYLAGTVWHCLWLRRPDSFVTLTTPAVLPVVGSVFSTLRRARHVIWEMDVYPDIATDIGYFRKDGIVDYITGAILDWSRRRSDAIIVLGEDMKARLVARGIPESKIHVAENWADGVEITPLKFPQGPLVIHYSGNLGLAHETETIATVIGRLRNHPDFKFIFAGGGPRRTELESFCRAEDIRNVDFRPYCARTELGRSLANGHLGLVTQLPQTLGSVVPSKIYGIMAAGRPLLYIGPNGSTPACHIDRFNCGWHVQPGDAEGLEYLLLHLSRNRSLLSEAGARARTAFEQNFDRSIGVNQILRILGASPQIGELAHDYIESVKGD